METLVQATRGAIALTAFFLLFFSIVHASAGSWLPALATLAVGLAGTVYVFRTRGKSPS